MNTQLNAVRLDLIQIWLTNLKFTHVKLRSYTYGKTIILY